jgi:hypothetical protein
MKVSDNPKIKNTLCAIATARVSGEEMYWLTEDLGVEQNREE